MFTILCLASAVLGLFGVIDESLALILATSFFGASFIVRMARIKV